MLGSAVGSHLGWRWAFYLAGLPGAVLAVVLFFFRDPPRGANDAELDNDVPLRIRPRGNLD